MFEAGLFCISLQADPPKPEKIPEEDILGVTVLLLTCSYLGQEFIRVGYYVSNDYIDEQLREEPPPKVLLDKVQRNILADKPRVTKFPIVFTPPCTTDVTMINPPSENSSLFGFPPVDDTSHPMDAEHSNLGFEVENSNLLSEVENSYQ
jgi:histone chaperone ASF1